MWPASERFFESLARGGDRVSKVEVLADGDVVKTITAEDVPDPATGTFVQSVGGRVEVSRQKIRRSGSVDLLDVSGQVLPDEVGDLLVPLRGEIRPYVGLRYWDATPAETFAGTDVEYVPVATLVITGIAGDYPRYTVSGFDRMFLLPKLTDPHGTTLGTNARTALVHLLTKLVPASRLSYNIPTTEHTTGANAWEEDADSADIAQQLAVAAGWMFYCDPLGVFTALDEPSTDDPPAMDYSPGALSMLMRPTREVDAKDAVNTVVATSESQDTKAVPFRSVVTDNDPTSITYVAAVGRRPFRHSSPLYRTQAQTDLGARTVFRREVGIADTLVVPVVPNPCLEGGDVLRVEDPAQGIDLAVLADAFTVGLRAGDGPQSITCRSRVIR